MDAKYACAFSFNIVGSQPSEFEEVFMLELIGCNYSAFYSSAFYACCTCRNFEGLLAGSFSYIVSCLIWQDKHNLGDIIQMYHQAKARQLSTQSDASSLVYPEFILPYLVHALAHHSCPDIDECKDVKAFEPIYWYICFHMYIFFSLKCNFWYFSYEKSFTRKGEKYV